MEHPRAEATGFYLQPLMWVGAPPSGLVLGANPGSGPGPADFEELKEIVAETSLPQSLRARVFRDGLFVFDFSQWAPYRPEHLTLGNFEGLAKLALRRVGLMNAYLACLFTALMRTQHFATDPMALTPGAVFSINSFEDVEGGMGLPNQLLGHIYLARFPSTYSPVMPPNFDFRISLRSLIESRTIDESFSSFGELLNHSSPERVLTLSELLVRSGAAYWAHDYNLCLITAWAIIEALLQEQWDKYLEDNRQRETDGSQVPFINRRRKDQLTGRDVTASLMAEILSLVDRLPFALYQRLSEARRARNDWIHSLDPVSGTTAQAAIQVAEDMLRLVKGVDLEMPKGLRLSF